jgi:hypothetical protein
LNDAPALVSRSRGLLIATAVLAFIFIYFWSRSPALAEGFRSLYAGMETKITPMTEFVLRLPNIWALMSAPAVALLVWMLARPRVTQRELRNMKIAFAATVVFAVALYAFTAYVLLSRFSAPAAGI